jgi:nitrate/nitrite transport system ATP-binding protein
MITNDVDEALILADRILCLNPDGTLGQSFAVTLPRPRDRAALNHGAFKSLRADVTAYLMDVGIRSKLPGTRLLPTVTPRHAIPGAYKRASASPLENRYLHYSQLPWYRISI